MFKNITEKTERSILCDFLICLFAIAFMAVFYYGWRALIVTAVSVLTCYVCDVTCVYFRKNKLILTDFSAVSTAIIFAMLMPASVPYPILIVSCIIMIIIGKQAFGGNENPVFSTVAVGYAFASLCWKEAILLFPTPVPMGQLDLSSSISGKLMHSFTYTIGKVSVPATSPLDLLLGRFLGPMGTTHIIVLLVCAVCLSGRRSISFLTFFTGLSTLLANAFFFPLSIRASRFSSVEYELISGASVFILIFIAADLKTAPKTKIGRAIYGIIIALLTIIFRGYANIETGMIFAILIANVLSDTTDKSPVFFKFLFKWLLRVIKLLSKFPVVIIGFVISVIRFISEKSKKTSSVKIVLVDKIAESKNSDGEISEGNSDDSETKMTKLFPDVSDTQENYNDKKEERTTNEE